MGGAELISRGCYGDSKLPFGWLPQYPSNICSRSLELDGNGSAPFLDLKEFLDHCPPATWALGDLIPYLTLENCTALQFSFASPQKRGQELSPCKC